MRRAGKKGYTLRVLVEKPEQKDKFEDTSLQEKIIFTYIFKKCYGWLRDRWRALVYGNKLTVFVKCGEFLDQLRICCLQEDSVAWYCSVGWFVGQLVTYLIIQLVSQSRLTRYSFISVHSQRNFVKLLQFYNVLPYYLLMYKVQKQYDIFMKLDAGEFKKICYEFRVVCKTVQQ